MKRFGKPKIVVSACLNLEPVRYDGKFIKDEFVLKLKKYCEFINVCPEVEIGLGVPRNKIIVYKKGKNYGLYQPAGGLELTDKMIKFSEKFLDSLNEIDGFLLKSKSPSCGVSGTVIYKDKREKIYHSKGKGIFALKVLEKFPFLPVEDEKRLKNTAIKDHFLTSIFAIADLRDLIKNIKKVEELMNFHQRYKYLLMLYSQSKLKEMGRLVAGYDKNKNLKDILEKYRELFLTVFKKKPSKGRHINVVEHIFGHISDRLNKKEKNYFKELLEKYRKGFLEINTLKEILKSFAQKFKEDYIINQVYLEPYPEDLT